MNRSSASLIVTTVTLAALPGLGGCLDPASQGSSSHRGAVAQASYLDDLGSTVPVVRTGNTDLLSDDFTPSCMTDSFAPDGAYTWTAPSTGTFTFSTGGSSFDTVLDIRLDHLSSVGCNDDSDGTLQSLVHADLAAGQTVWVIVDGSGNSEGFFRLEISASPPWYCGDGYCNNGETKLTCPGDCDRTLDPT